MNRNSKTDKQLTSVMNAVEDLNPNFGSNNFFWFLFQIWKKYLNALNLNACFSKFIPQKPFENIVR